MNKLLNYIVRGKDSGAFLLFALAFLLALYTAFSLRSPMLEMVPYVQEQADKMLPITVENGHVTDPVNTVREVDLASSDEDDDGFVIVLDTTLDELSKTDLPEGVYITRSYIYRIEKDSFARETLTGSFTLEKKDYTAQFQSLVRWAVLAIVAVVLFLGFLYFLVMTWIYAFLAWLLAKLMKLTTTHEFRMRLSSVLFCTLYIIVFVAELFGLELPQGVFSLLILAGEFALLRYFANALKPAKPTRKKKNA